MLIIPFVHDLISYEAEVRLVLSLLIHMKKLRLRKGRSWSRKWCMQEAPHTCMLHPPPLLAPPPPQLDSFSSEASETLFSQGRDPSYGRSPEDTEALYKDGVMCPGI